jgi:hypothetical protein
MDTSTRSPLTAIYNVRYAAIKSQSMIGFSFHVRYKFDERFVKSMFE